MDLLTTLKKLQHAQADPVYTARSRSIILHTAQPLPPLRMLGRWMLRNVESGATLALAGLCLFLVVAGFSLWKSFSPLGIAQFDLASLRAEAQAIDIQIKLAGLAYEESTLPVAAALRSPSAALQITGSPQSPRTPNAAAGTAAAPVLPDKTATSTPVLSIDEALLKLSE
ncbi:MAG: hypothetical protein HYW65_04320 [Candidatus Liptonbacteria bacterium]|nr:hypothetical protein [Candidatus Liptonbacteria bacterium]